MKLRPQQVAITEGERGRALAQRALNGFLFDCLSILFVDTGTVGYDELGSQGVSRILEVKILRFGAPLFFANVGILKVSLTIEVL